MGMKIDSVQLAPFHLGPDKISFSPEMRHHYANSAQKAALLSQSPAERVHFSSLAQLAQAHEMKLNAQEIVKSQPVARPGAAAPQIPRITPAQAMLSAEMLNIGKPPLESNACEVHPEFNYFSCPIVKDKDDGHQDEARRDEQQEEAFLQSEEEEMLELDDLFTPTQAQSLGRGFITLSFKWLGEEKARQVVPKIFPPRREKDREKYLSGLYNHMEPVNSEYAQEVALNIVSLLKEMNPGEDITPTLELMLQVGGKCSLLDPPAQNKKP